MQYKIDRQSFGFHPPASNAVYWKCCENNQSTDFTWKLMQ